MGLFMKMAVTFSSVLVLIFSGAMKVDILNGKGESVNKLPGDRRRLLVELKVIWHGKVPLYLR